jgi:hypothetical protein
MIALSAIILLARRRTRIEPKLKESVLLWVLMGGFASFMMTSVSYPLGSLIPKIDIGVFTWRMLSITTLVVAMLAGACAHAARDAFSEGRRADLAWLMSLAGLMTVGGLIFSVTAVWGPMYRAMRFVPVPEHINYAMLPREAPKDPLELPVVGEAELESGRGRVEIKRWDPEHREMEVILDGSDRLLVRTFNFPGWTATVDGERVPAGTGQALRVELSDSSQSLIREATFDGGTPVVYGRAGRIIGKEPLGDITLDLGPGAYNIKLDYLDTPARSAGKLVSGISFLALLTILIVRRVRRV